MDEMRRRARHLVQYFCQCNPNKILDFYEKLCSNMLSLETMGKFGEVNGYVRMTLNKLEGIRADLVWTDDEWKMEISSTCRSVTGMDGAKPAEMRWCGRSREAIQAINETAIQATDQTASILEVFKQINVK